MATLLSTTVSGTLDVTGHITGGTSTSTNESQIIAQSDMGNIYLHSNGSNDNPGTPGHKGLYCYNSSGTGCSIIGVDDSNNIYIDNKEVYKWQSVGNTTGTGTISLSSTIKSSAKEFLIIAYCPIYSNTYSTFSMILPNRDSWLGWQNGIVALPGYYYSASYYGSVFVTATTSSFAFNTNWTRINGNGTIYTVNSNFMLYVYYR